MTGLESSFNFAAISFSLPLSFPSITTSFLFLKGNHSYPYTTNSFLSNPLNKSSTTALSARNAIINLIDTPLGAPVVRTSQRYAAGPSDG